MVLKWDQIGLLGLYDFMTMCIINGYGHSSNEFS